MTVSDYLANRIIDTVFRGRIYSPGSTWASLHMGDPGITGANEVPTPSNYARQQIAASGWIPAVSRTTENIYAIEFPNMPSAAGITHLGLWDRVSAGNFLVGSVISSPGSITTVEGDVVHLNAGRLIVVFL